MKNFKVLLSVILEEELKLPEIRIDWPSTHRDIIMLNTLFGVDIDSRVAFSKKRNTQEFLDLIIGNICSTQNYDQIPIFKRDALGRATGTNLRKLSTACNAHYKIVNLPFEGDSINWIND